MYSSYMLPEQSIRDMCALLAELTGGEKPDPSDAVGKYVSVPGFYTRIMLAPMCPEEEDAAMDKILTSGISLVSFTQGNVSAAMQAKLTDAGYKLGVSQTGMLINLTDREDLRPDEHVLHVRPEDIRRWSDTVNQGMQKPDEFPAFQAMAGCDKCHFYVYEEDGRWLGTTLLYSRDGNAGIHEVGVIPEFRRRGIASALVRHALYEARRSGVSFSTLQASPTGALVYAGLGFQKLSMIDNWRKAAP